MKKVGSIFMLLTLLMCAVPSFAERIVLHDWAGAWKWIDGKGEKYIIFLRTDDGMCDYMIRKDGSLNPLDSGISWIDEKNTLTLDSTVNQKVVKSASYTINTKLSDNEYLLSSSGGERIRLMRFEDKALAIKYVKKAKSFNKKKDYKQALHFAIQASEIDPRSIDAWLQRGDGYVGIKDYGEASASYNKVLEINRDNKEAEKKLIQIQKIIEKNMESYDGP